MHIKRLGTVTTIQWVFNSITYYYHKRTLLLFTPGNNPSEMSIKMGSLTPNNKCLTQFKTLLLILGIPCLSSIQHSVYSNADYKVGVDYFIKVSWDHKAWNACAPQKGWSFKLCSFPCPGLQALPFLSALWVVSKFISFGHLSQEKWTLFLHSCYILVSFKSLSKRQNSCKT